MAVQPANQKKFALMRGYSAITPSGAAIHQISWRERGRLPLTSHRRKRYTYLIEELESLGQPESSSGGYNLNVRNLAPGKKVTLFWVPMALAGPGQRTG